MQVTFGYHHSNYDVRILFKHCSIQPYVKYGFPKWWGFQEVCILGSICVHSRCTCSKADGSFTIQIWSLPEGMRKNTTWKSKYVASEFSQIGEEIWCRLCIIVQLYSLNPVNVCSTMLSTIFVQHWKSNMWTFRLSVSCHVQNSQLRNICVNLYFYWATSGLQAGL